MLRRDSKKFRVGEGDSVLWGAAFSRIPVTMSKNPVQRSSGMKRICNIGNLNEREIKELLLITDSCAMRSDLRTYSSPLNKTAVLKMLLHP